MVTSIQTSSFKKIIIATLLVAAGVAGYYALQNREGVYTYDAAKDRAFILSLFDKDTYWLLSDYSKDYDPAKVLDTKTPAMHGPYAGKLIIKVYRVKGKPVGFIAYYPKELLEGDILFLGVSGDYRTKGVGRKLATYAIDDIKHSGARVVRLLTRTDNVKARKLYESLGFKEFWTDGAYVRYERYF